MKEAKFEQQLFIEAPVETCFRFLSDIDKQTQLHPLIVAVRELDRGRSPHGERYLVWEVTDRLSLLGLAFKVKYQTKMTLSDAPSIAHEARQAMRIVVFARTTFQPQGTGTLVQETVTVRAPGLLFGFTARQAQLAHKKMLVNLKALLEGGK